MGGMGGGRPGGYSALDSPFNRELRKLKARISELELQKETTQKDLEKRVKQLEKPVEKE